MSLALKKWRFTLRRREVDLKRRTKQLAKARARLQKASDKAPNHHALVVSAEKAKTRLAATQKAVDEAKAAIHKLEVQENPLRLRAHKVAEGLLGVMEVGGNNIGPTVSRIIRANGGTPGEAWCGDFQAYCYRLAGSHSVTRSWASVYLLGLVAGVRRTSSPRKGNMVRFTFGHVGMFEKDNGNGTITTIEGNTGHSGAVSDSRTGGDGVYRKIRSKALVKDYLNVTR